MLLANETVAKYGAKLRQGKKQLPFVYRVHDEPDPSKLEQFAAIAARLPEAGRRTGAMRVARGMGYANDDVLMRRLEPIVA